MSNQRRRAQDFTDSLATFRQMIDEESNQASSEDRLSYRRKKQDEGAECLRNKEFHSSIILAGNLASQQYTSLSDSSRHITKKNHNTVDNNDELLPEDTWKIYGDMDETSYLSMKPDLNKCIDLFHNDLIEENLPRSMSADSINDISFLDEKFAERSKSYTTFDRILKRDTNYNIKADQLSSSPKIAMNVNCSETVEPLTSSFNSLSLKPTSSSKKDFCSIEDSHMYSTSNEKSSKEALNPSELRRFLNLLDVKSSKETVMQQQLLRRLSANYYDSPKTFTEKLLTIIEESVINDSSQHPDVTLRKFNKEVRKMCKFIEDETVLEWPQSPGTSTPIYAKRKSQERKSNLSSKCLTFKTPDKDLISVSPQCNIKSLKKICRRMSRNTSYTSKNLYDSTNTFENLEAYCKKLYPNENIAFSAKRNQQSPLRNMDDIRRTCETQMASLDDSFNIYEEVKRAQTCISDSANQHKTSEHKLISSDRMDSKRVSDTFKQRTKRSNHHEVSKLDFENTLIYEIAKKRQRCLDTAKTTMDINTNLKSTETTKETYPTIVISESSPTANDDKFIKILMRVKKYQDYLEQHKSLLNFLHHTRSSSPHNRKNTGIKKKNENFNTRTPSVLLGNKPTLQTPKFPTKKKSTSPSAKYRHKQDEPNINPHARKIYQRIGNYDHVVSPVAMYIKGKSPLKNKNKA